MDLKGLFLFISFCNIYYSIPREDLVFFLLLEYFSKISLQCFTFFSSFLYSQIAVFFSVKCDLLYYDLEQSKFSCAPFLKHIEAIRGSVHRSWHRRSLGNEQHMLEEEEGEDNLP